MMEKKFSVQDYISELKNDPYLKEYDIDINNVNSFEDALTEMHNCENCLGLDSCKNIETGYQTVIVKTQNGYNFPVKPCRFLQIKRNRTSVENLFIPADILQAKLVDYDINTPERKKIFDYLNGFIDKLASKKFAKGLFISGPYATGKTFTLAACANALAERGVRTIIAYFPDLVRELKNAISSGSAFEEIIKSLKSVPVLMLDDFGSEMMTSWLRDEIIGPIINYRLGEKLPIFISTNLTVVELVNHLTITKDTAPDPIKAGRIMDRIKALTQNCDIGEAIYKR